MKFVGSFPFSVASFKHNEAMVYGIRFSLPVTPCLQVSAITIFAITIYYFSGFLSLCVVLHVNSTIVVSYVKYTIFGKL